MKTIEELIFKIKFPDEDFNADNFNDWVTENSFDAYYQCLLIAQKLQNQNQELLFRLEGTNY